MTYNNTAKNTTLRIITAVGSHAHSQQAGSLCPRRAPLRRAPSRRRLRRAPLSRPLSRGGTSGAFPPAPLSWQPLRRALSALTLRRVPSAPLSRHPLQHPPPSSLAAAPPTRLFQHSPYGTPSTILPLSQHHLRRAPEKRLAIFRRKAVSAWTFFAEGM